MKPDTAELPKVMNSVPVPASAGGRLRVASPPAAPPLLAVSPGARSTAPAWAPPAVEAA